MRQIDAQIISLLLLARLLVLRPESGLRWQTILLEALINTLQRAKVISKSAYTTLLKLKERNGLTDDLKNKIDVFFAIGRITEEQYNELMDIEDEETK